MHSANGPAYLIDKSQSAPTELVSRWPMTADKEVVDASRPGPHTPSVVASTHWRGVSLPPQYPAEGTLGADPPHRTH